MLVLKRKAGESILIGDSITVTVVRIGEETVRLAIDAPLNYRVDRAEIRERPDYDANWRPITEGAE